MNTALDYFHDGYEEWGKINYGIGFKVYRGTKNGSYEKAMNYSIYYMLVHLQEQINNEKNTTKTKSKANTKSKLKDGKQTKGVLKAKKRVS